MLWSRRAIVLPLVLLLAGCTVGPNYRPPEVNLPAGYSEAPATQPAVAPTPGGAAAATQPALPGAGVASADLAQWWTTFHDARLDALIAHAVRANFDLQAAEARVRQARAQRGIVGAAQFPQVDSVGSYARNRATKNAPGAVPLTRNAEFDLFQAGFDASWELDVFGRVRRSVEAADADIQVALDDRGMVLVSLLAELARTYVDLREAQYRLVIARDNLKTQQSALELAQARFKGGLTNELDVAQAQAQLATTQSQVPVLETAERVSIHALGVLVGQAPGALLPELAPPAPLPAPPSAIAAGLPADLLRRRPDVRRAERQLAAQTARIGVAVSDLYPRFAVNGSLGLSSTDAGRFFSSGSTTWSIGPSATWNVFDAGRIRSNIQLQDAAAQQLLAQYQQSVLLALEEVEDALIASTKEQEHRQALAEAVAANRRAVELATLRYEKGLTSFLDVLESQRALYATQDALAQSEASLVADAIALYKALGGGWEAGR